MSTAQGHRLHGHGLSVQAPAGWSGRLYLRGGGAGAVANPTLHLATVPVPADAGDFGSSIAAALGPQDILVVLAEFSLPAAKTALFAPRGLPMPEPDEFHPAALQRTIRGQSGYQRFFTWRARPFCLYVVLGSHARRYQLVPRVHQLLAGMSVEPGPALTGSAP